MSAYPRRLFTTLKIKTILVRLIMNYDFKFVEGEGRLANKMAPFHLEFINSKEAFLAVLKVRFQQCGVTPKGLRKIDRFEFILCDR